MAKKHKKKPTTTFGKVWYFIWEDNSVWSWLANIVLAYLLIKFIVYPLIGLILGTSFPIVAVVSGSMDHGVIFHDEVYDSTGTIKLRSAYYSLCGHSYPSKPDSVNYWEQCGKWYEDNINITEEQFFSYPLSEGFSRGDIIILRGPDDVNIGDVIVFASKAKTEPIIHRVIDIDENHIYTTKGDNNEDSYTTIDKNITESALLGKAWLRLPYLGYVKIGFFDLLAKLKIVKPIQ